MVFCQVQVFRGDPQYHSDAVSQQRDLLPTKGQDRARRHRTSELLCAWRRPPHASQRLQPGTGHCHLSVCLSVDHSMLLNVYNQVLTALCPSIVLCLSVCPSSATVCTTSVELSCQRVSHVTVLGVEMQAVEVDAHRHQHTQANLDGLR